MKKVLGKILIILFIISIPFCYFIYDNLFPKADPITSPEIENVMSISITLENSETYVMEEKRIEGFLEIISDSKPTRTLALNEVPGIEKYYSIVIHTSEREVYYFIYKEDSKVYIFAPYEGVYEADQKILSFIFE